MEPTFGARLKAWIAFRGIKPAQLARALGVSRPTMHAWLNADALPRGHRLPGIVAALSITQAEFYGALPDLAAATSDVEERTTERFPPLAKPVGAPPPPVEESGDIVEDVLLYDLDPPEETSGGEAA